MAPASAATQVLKYEVHGNI